MPPSLGLGKFVFQPAVIEKKARLDSVRKTPFSDTAALADELKLEMDLKTKNGEDWEDWERFGGLEALKHDLRPNWNKSAPLTDEGASGSLQHIQDINRTEIERRGSEMHSQALPKHKHAARKTPIPRRNPLRSSLEKYALDAICDHWSGGANVNSQTGNQFAADILCRVVKSYDAETVSNQAGIAFRPPLTLSDLKWVYNWKVKPLVEPICKQPFKCSACEKSKPYGFEGLISHYSMKHTDEFRRGNSVVAWEVAKWPKNPPFEVMPGPDPNPTGWNSRPDRSGSSLLEHRPFEPASVETMDRSATARSLDMLYSYGTQPSSLAVHGKSAFRAPSVFHPSSTGPADASGFSTGLIHQPRPQIVASPRPFTGVRSAPQFPSSQPFSFPSQQLLHVSDFHQAQLEKVTNIALEVWSALLHVRSLDSGLRMHVIIHHVVSRFQHHFSNEPNLDLFAECLTSHPMMGPLRDVQDLACKTCVRNNLSHEEAQSQALCLQSGARKFYSFYSLLFHFKNVHASQFKAAVASEDPGGRHPDSTGEVHRERLDWKEDMVELPPRHRVMELRDMPGVGDRALRLIDEVIPGICLSNPQLKVESRSPEVYSYQGSHSGYVPYDNVQIVHRDSFRPEPRIITTGRDQEPSYEYLIRVPRDRGNESGRPIYMDSSAPASGLGQASNSNYATVEAARSYSRAGYPNVSCDLLRLSHIIS